MACCVLAALIVAHVMAILRRWAVFWGLVRPGEYDNPDTAPRRIRSWLSRPRVRTAVRCFVVAEVAALGLWAYAAHGTHLYQWGDETLARMRGEQVVYSAVCGTDGKDYAVRLVIDSSGAVVRRDVVAGSA